MSKEPTNHDEATDDLQDDYEASVAEMEAQDDDGLPADIEDDMQRAPDPEVDNPVDKGDLKEEAGERARKRPFVQRIAKSIKSEDAPFREIIVNSEPLEKRVAVLVDGVLEKYEIERIGEERIVGSIFRGKIQNLEPGLKAAFVDIGRPKNAFLHYWDILPAANDNNIEYVRDTRTQEQRDKRDKITLKDIPKLYPIGSNIVIQVTKSTIGTKGPRTTTNISLPGRFLVLMPHVGQCGISRKIEDREERKRLRKILEHLDIPEGMGVIIRTAGEGKKLRYFVRDLRILLQTWKEIQERIEASKQPSEVYEEPDLLERTMRDFLTEDVDRVLVDSEDDYEGMVESVSRISPRARSKIQLFRENIPIFERFNIERQIEQTYQRSVPLPSGGAIVIDETEALTAIDVNTGAHKNKDDGKNFILQVNIEAAREIARQVRLRNIGGLIVLDFIDMKQKKDQRAVLRVMKEEMEKDKAKNQILPISPLGIMQMTRQRHEESMSSGLYTGCPYCSGRGIVKSSRTMSVEIQRRLVSVIRRLRNDPKNLERAIKLRILCHPHCLERLRTEDERLLVEIEKLYEVELAFRADPAYHVENFKILEASTNVELR